MGNSQASNGAGAVIIQYPSGKIKRINRSVTAGEVMHFNPGHFVSIIMQMNPGHNYNSANQDDSTIVSFTRVKLLRPHESLVLGTAYRLLTTEEVIKVMRANMYGKMKNKKKNNNDIEYVGINTAERQIEKQVDEETKLAARSKSWRPSLRSISEAGW